MKRVMLCVLSAFLMCGSVVVLTGQVKSDAKKTGTDVKDAAKDAGKTTAAAAKKTGTTVKKGAKAVKKDTKKVVHKSAEETKKGATAVEKKTAPKKP